MDSAFLISRLSHIERMARNAREALSIVEIIGPDAARAPLVLAAANGMQQANPQAAKHQMYQQNTKVVEQAIGEMLTYASQINQALEEERAAGDGGV